MLNGSHFVEAQLTIYRALIVGLTSWSCNDLQFMGPNQEFVARQPTDLIYFDLT